MLKGIYKLSDQKKVKIEKLLSGMPVMMRRMGERIKVTVSWHEP